MREISLHLLDLVQNSITAGAKQIGISFTLDSQGVLAMVLQDNGCGMDEATLQRALSPFGTSRHTRKVGFGIPLTQEHALASGGSFEITSEPGKGTRVMAAFNTRHLDCQPLGKLGDTLLGIILANPDSPDFALSLSAPGCRETLSTLDIKRALDPLPINCPEAILWLQDTLNQMTEHCFGGKGL